MLSETRLAMRFSTTAYDMELASLLGAGKRDLELAGIQIAGKLLFPVSGGIVTDESTITDELVKRALITYVRCHFGSPSDYDRLKAAYDEQKAQLMSATGYGLPDEAVASS